METESNVLMQLPNHTQVPNHMIDIFLREMEGSAIKCFLAICRKTIGWHKASDYISFSQLKELTGLSNGGIEAGTKELVSRGLITVKKSKGRTNKYDINFDTTLLSREVDATGKRGTTLLSREDHSTEQRGTTLLSRDTKETLKETIQKKKKPAAPAVSYHEKLVQKFRSAEEKGELPYIVLYGFELKNNGPFGNYAKEWKAVRQVEKKVRTVCTGDQDRVHFLRLMMSAYLWKKARSKSEFWREAPLTPSGLNSRWDQTYEVCRKRLSEQGDMDWIKKAMAHS